jgi:hypothetical protein
MEEILHHLGWLKPYKEWDKPPINWCRISSINSRSVSRSGGSSIVENIKLLMS